MKHKLLYLISGLLTLSILAGMFFGPSLYFSYEDWSQETGIATEEAGLEKRNTDMTIKKKLHLFAKHSALQGSRETLTTSETRLSTTFIPSGREIRQSYLVSTIKTELQNISYYFDTIKIKEILTQLYSENFSEGKTSCTMMELVSLSEATEGFVLWSVEYMTDVWDCHFFLDAETGTLYSIGINYYPSYENEPLPYGEEDNDLMVRNLYQFSGEYWELNLAPEDTRYAPTANDSDYYTSYSLNCDAPSLSMSVNLTYAFSYADCHFSLQPIYY